jgi:uncharacterized membrane protein
MTERSKPRSRWALPLSLAINVFLVAVIAVHLWHRPPGPPGPPGPDPHHMVDEIARFLPGADATILRDAFASEAVLQQDPRATMEHNMERVREALRADPFDPAALAAVLREGHEARDADDQAIARALLKAATAMSPEGRRLLAEYGGPPHGPGGPGGPPHGPGGPHHGLFGPPDGGPPPDEGPPPDRR